MLSLSAAHLRVMRESNPKQRLIWVDIGGGTGHNIELMDKHFPISSFDAVYLVDLCEPLLQVARKRFAEKGWGNVTVLCQDASEFSLPEWAGKDPKGTVGFVTLSYSLSMVYTLPFIPPFLFANIKPDPQLLRPSRPHLLHPFPILWPP